MKYGYLLVGVIAVTGCESPARLSKSELGPWIEVVPAAPPGVEAPKVAHVEARPRAKRVRVSIPPRPPEPPPEAPVVTVEPPLEPAEPARPPAPALVPRPAPPPRAEPRRAPSRDRAIEIAATVGGGGLALAAVGAGIGLEDANPGALVLSGLGLGVGVLGLATAGVLALMDEQDEPNDRSAARVEPSGLGLTVRF